MNIEQMQKQPRVRALIAGYPGAGKTGSLACLANAGFKLRVLNFGGQPESLAQYAIPGADVDVISLEDKYVLTGAVATVSGMPSAFANAWKMLDRWRYEDDERGTLDEKTGKKYVDLGASKDWGPDTIVVLDGTTGMASAAMDYARAAMNKTPLNQTRQVWGVASNNMEAFIKRAGSMNNKHHFICIAHVKPIGPEAEADGDSDFMKQLKREKAELIDTKLFPTGVGRQLPQTIAGNFPICITAEVRTRGMKSQRILSAVAREDMTTKLPVLDITGCDALPVETGMLTIFEKLGVKKP